MIGLLNLQRQRANGIFSPPTAQKARALRKLPENRDLINYGPKLIGAICLCINIRHRGEVQNKDFIYGAHFGGCARNQILIIWLICRN
jgi:hypothetical protein